MICKGILALVPILLLPREWGNLLLGIKNIIVSDKQDEVCTMSGINGYLQFTKIKNDTEIKNIIKMMNKEVWHRGPDSEAIYLDEEVGLGVRTLSPGELSPENHLLYNEDKTKILIFDGSILKGHTLKEQLEKRGHRFFSGNSMEVVLHAYEEYGVDCFKMVDGMFSLALYDAKRQQLVLARDKVGQKPLYYYQDNYYFLFGSELKSLLAAGLINKKINTEALNQYFQLTYIPAPHTIFENIYKLSPGCYLRINLKGKVSIQSYWDLVYSDSNLITDYSECKRLLRKAVINSVEERMSNIAPIGSFLSGGIDSTIITGVMSKLSKKPIDTFTIGFKEKAINESDMARIVADKYRTHNHVYYLDYDEAFGEIDKIINQLDEPFADPAAIPTYMIAKFAKQYVNTVLTGDSGDELFAGYNKYLIRYYSDLYRKIPSFLRKYLIEKIVYILPDNSSISRKVRKVIANVDKDVFWQRQELMCLGFKENELNFLLNHPAKLGSLDFIKKNYDQYKDITNELSQTLYTDFKVVLEGDMIAILGFKSSFIV
jgi:asparagine synthase (glutamine-hydrolysing)